VAKQQKISPKDTKAQRKHKERLTKHSRHISQRVSCSDFANRELIIFVILANCYLTITEEEEETLKIDELTIKVEPIWKWLLKSSQTLE